MFGAQYSCNNEFMSWHHVHDFTQQSIDEPDHGHKKMYNTLSLHAKEANIREI